MMENFEYFIALLLLLVVGVLVIKKVTGCIIRLVVGLVMVAIVVWLLSLLGVL